MNDPAILTNPGTRLGLQGLPQRLVADGLVADTAMVEALAASKERRQQIVSYLVEYNLADAREIVERAEKRAARLAAQGEAEFEAVLRAIREQEEIERELRDRVAVLDGSTPATPRTGRRTFGSVRRPLAALRRQASER